MTTQLKKARYASGAALAFSLAALAGTVGAVPGYVTSEGDMAVTSATGQCWRTGEWTPEMARSPCDGTPRAAAAPVPVVQTPPAAPAPAPLAAAPVIQKLTLSTDVLFEFNKADLRQGGQQKLDELAQRAQGADVDKVVVVGFADRIGSEQYNQELSERRAAAVKDYLASKNVDAQRVQAEGRGESQPVTGDQCKNMGKEHKSNSKLVSCLQPDRRVDIELLGSRQVAGGAPASSGSSGSGSSPSGASSGSSR
jgi:OOP family OmpA-OmpF porin